MRTYDQIMADVKGQIVMRENGLDKTCFDMTPREAIMVYRRLEYKPGIYGPVVSDTEILQSIITGNCAIGGFAIRLVEEKVLLPVTHELKPVKVGSVRTGHDWDMELVGDVWDVNRTVVCPRCQRRYREGHHDTSMCRKMFTEEQVADMKIWRH